MPRTLPWLAENAATQKSTAKAKFSVKAPSASPGDLVGSDLEDLDHEPARYSRADTNKAPYREPSSSPPPVVQAPPPEENMRQGYAADDGWMMVEDEFYSTAQLFTQHLHQEAYADLKKQHKARGQETLAALARGTDGRTAQSRQLQLKLQAEENAKKRKQAVAHDGDSEDDDDDGVLDPQLAGLMTGSQIGRAQNRSRVAQARSRRSLAEDEDDESSDPVPEPKPDLSPVEEENGEGDEETDSDDLSRPPRKQLPATEMIISRPAASDSRGTSALPRNPPPEAPGPETFTQFARAKVEEQRSFKDESVSSSFPSSPPLRLPAPTRMMSETTFTSRSLPPVKHEDSSSPVNKSSRPTSVQVKEEPGLRISTFLAKRRAQREKEQAEAKRKDIEDSIPTFLF